MRIDLEAVAAPVASAIGAVALIAGALTLAVTRRPRLALSIFLDLLLAAGLLRLAGEPGWRAIATAAAIIALRRLIGTGLRIGGSSWTSTTGDGGAMHRRLVPVRRLFRPAWWT